MAEKKPTNGSDEVQDPSYTYERAHPERESPSGELKSPRLRKAKIPDQQELVENHHRATEQINEEEVIDTMKEEDPARDEEEQRENDSPPPARRGNSNDRED
jgi:hypothetical protein